MENHMNIFALNTHMPHVTNLKITIIYSSHDRINFICIYKNSELRSGMCIINLYNSLKFRSISYFYTTQVLNFNDIYIQFVNPIRNHNILKIKGIKIKVP